MSYFIYPDQLFKYLLKPQTKAEKIYIYTGFHAHSQYNIVTRLYVIARAAEFARACAELGIKAYICATLDEIPSSLNAIYHPSKYLRAQQAAKKCKIANESTPYFMLEASQHAQFHTNKKLTHKSFYVQARKLLGILVEPASGTNQKPVGGLWSYDIYNRDPLKNSEDFVKRLSKIKYGFAGAHRDAAFKFAAKYLGESANISHEVYSIFPINWKEAEQQLVRFLANLNYFGAHQDHILKYDGKWSGIAQYHSALSSALNYGLITPRQCVDAAIKLQSTSQMKDLEGYIRQLFWREYMWVIYERHCGADSIDLPNYFRLKSRLGDIKWDRVGISLLLDTHTKAQKYAYVNHIERLMVLACFFTLAEIVPNDMFVYFGKVVSIDTGSTDWVMFGNILMGSFCDGGSILGTKLYTCGANYLRKMSNYTMQEEIAMASGKFTAEIIWTALYWRFMAKYNAKLKATRGAMRIPEDINKKIKIGNDYLHHIGL